MIKLAQVYVIEASITDLSKYRAAKDMGIRDIAGEDLEPDNIPHRNDLERLIGPGSAAAIDSGKLVVMSPYGTEDVKTASGDVRYGGAIAFASGKNPSMPPFAKLVSNKGWVSTNWFSDDDLGKGWVHLTTVQKSKDSERSKIKDNPPEGSISWWKKKGVDFSSLEDLMDELHGDRWSWSDFEIDDKGGNIKASHFLDGDYVYDPTTKSWNEE